MTNNEKQLMEGKYSVVYGLPYVAWSWHHEDDKFSQASTINKDSKWGLLSWWANNL